MSHWELIVRRLPRAIAASSRRCWGEIGKTMITDHRRLTTILVIDDAKPSKVGSPASEDCQSRERVYR